MPLRRLKVALGQCSDKGRKDVNQDFHGAYLPAEPLLSSKGVAIALADGISSSNVSQVASEAAVKAFLEDYYCTPETWSVKKSAQRVLAAVNSWLHSQTQHGEYRYDKDRGYVCTLSVLVIKASTAHLFHVGDSRIYRLRGAVLEQLTEDHRVAVSRETSYLGRALGINPQLEIDYRALPVERGDVFVLATDGAYERFVAQSLAETVRVHGADPDAAARALVRAAYESGADDNLTVQIVRVDELPDARLGIADLSTELPCPPELQPRMVLDGFTILREIHASSRSHLYLARDGDAPAPVVIKAPSVELRNDARYIERFLMEEWIARRIVSAHVVRPASLARKRTFLYTVTELVDGQTLTQWMIDTPRPSVEVVRGIVEQIAKGLLAFHRLEMLHQDLRPDNVMIDRTGTAKIVDFGSTRVAGIDELGTPGAEILGTMQYTAPEYFLGAAGTTRSDLFSLGVIAYQMLSGRLPYGADVPKARTAAAQRNLRYRSVLDDEREIPAWFDDVLEKATHPDPSKRYAELSELTYDLRHPSQSFLTRTQRPLLERYPVAFWKGVSLLLFALVLALALRAAMP